jgi:hypothetical protein
MLAQTGQHTHFNLAPAALPPRAATIGAKWHHHAISPEDQRQGRLLGRQRLGRRSVVARDGGQLLLEVLHSLLARRLHPTPHRAWAHRTATIPAQQSRRRGKRHKDRKRTAQVLEFPTGPLMGLHSQHLIQGGYLWDGTPVRTPSHTSSPAERAEQARDLTLGQALTAQRGPTARTGGPGDRPLGTLGEDIFKEMKGQDTC